MNDDLDPALLDALEGAGATLPPPDVVPTSGLTRAAVDALRAARGQTVTVTIPGEPVYGPDGDVVGMTETVTSSAVLAGLIITDQEADALGVERTGSGDE